MERRALGLPLFIFDRRQDSGNSKNAIALRSNTNVPPEPQVPLLSPNTGHSPL
jgi:hypothetical protein